MNLVLFEVLPHMILKNVFIATVCTVLLAWSSASLADEYRPDEFLVLDLSQAVLSPKRLGPSTKFAPVAFEARTDAGSEREQARMVPKAHVKIAVPKTSVADASVGHLRAEKPRGAVRTQLARSHGNPLDAEARDTRIQAWPCKSGGICNWQR